MRGVTAGLLCQVEVRGQETAGRFLKRFSDLLMGADLVREAMRKRPETDKYYEEVQAAEA